MSRSIPFGRYRGCPLEDLPDDYLQWLLTIELRTPLREAVREEAARRGRHADAGRDRHTGPAHTRRAVPDVTTVDELVSAGLRALARKYHPDAGGSHEQMIAVTFAADWLIAQVRGLSA